VTDALERRAVKVARLIQLRHRAAQFPPLVGCYFSNPADRKVVLLLPCTEMFALQSFHRVRCQNDANPPRMDTQWEGSRPKSARDH
jgi:hypothetical protein